MGNKQKFSMPPIKRTDVFQAVISRIESMITNRQQYKPGDRIPSERELAETLEVSRTSVRQALKVLEAAGKVETKMGSGTYVQEHVEHDSVQRLLPSTVGKDFLEQLIIARAKVERAIFEECCDRLDDVGLAELHQLVAENAHDFAKVDPDEIAGLDLSFESKVAELTGNIVLFRIQQDIHQAWVLAWNAYGYVPEDKRVLHAEHLELLAALGRRDKERVTELIVAHVDKDIA